MRPECDPLSHFENWTEKDLMERSRSFIDALQAAESMHRRVLTENTHATDPVEQFYAQIKLREARIDARLRRASQVTPDPIDRPVEAFEIDREKRERDADEEGRQRFIDDLLASTDPMAQYELEQIIKDTIFFGKKDL